eukprot:9571220-Alexandrium_andersonii.AAC.1
MTKQAGGCAGGASRGVRGYGARTGRHSASNNPRSAIRDPAIHNPANHCRLACVRPAGPC